MFEIPLRHQTRFVKTQPKIKTSYADPVVHFTMRREHESSYSDVFVAFPVASLPELDCVRVDFRTVIAQRYRSEQLGANQEGSGFEVSDESNFKSEVVDRYPHDKVYDAAEPIGSPEVAFRHFGFVFDEYGGIDIIARSARVLTFQRENLATRDQFERHQSVLKSALNLGWSDDW